MKITFKNKSAMDHVSATMGLSKTERENISGARVFDGEDQGKQSSKIFQELIILIKFYFFLKALEIDTECSSYSKETGASSK